MATINGTCSGYAGNSPGDAKFWIEWSYGTISNGKRTITANAYISGSKAFTSSYVWVNLKIGSSSSTAVVGGTSSGSNTSSHCSSSKQYKLSHSANATQKVATLTASVTIPNSALTISAKFEERSGAGGGLCSASSSVKIPAGSLNLTYNANGGTVVGSPSQDITTLIDTIGYYSNRNLYDVATFGVTRTGYEYPAGAEWNSEPDGSGVNIHQDTWSCIDLATALGIDLTTSDKSATLYVNWKAKGNCYINDNVTFKMGMMYVNDDETWKIGIVWLKDNEIWKQGIV